MMKKLLLFFLIFFVAQITCYAIKFSFAVFGDNRGGDRVLKEIVHKISADKSIKFAVNTGDITQGGSRIEYEKYWDISEDSRVKIHDVVGNHDLGFLNEGLKVFKEKYGETYYYFDYDNSRFIIIDNAGSRGLGRKQFKWLKGVLDTKKQIFVFLHKPLIDVTGYYPRHIMDSSSERTELNELLIKSNVKYIFAGHIHGYGREVHNKVVYVITGGAGAPLYLPHFSGGYYHYVKVSVDGNKITDEAVAVYYE